MHNYIMSIAKIPRGEKDSNEWSDALGRVFLAVFVAEWGDRTQAPPVFPLFLPMAKV